MNNSLSSLSSFTPTSHIYTSNRFSLPQIANSRLLSHSLFNWALRSAVTVSHRKYSLSRSFRAHCPALCHTLRVIFPLPVKRSPSPVALHPFINLVDVLYISISVRCSFQGSLTPSFSLYFRILAYFSG